MAAVFQPIRPSEVNPTGSELSNIRAVYSESGQPSMLQLNHVGLATQDAERLGRVLQEITGAAAMPYEQVPSEDVRVRFMDTGTCSLEVIEALGPDSPMARYLRRRGEGLHHIAFTVADIDQQLKQMRRAGFEPLSEQPKVGAGGKRIFFLHPKTTGRILIEFCQPAYQWSITVVGKADELKRALLSSGLVRLQAEPANCLMAAETTSVDQPWMQACRSIVWFRPSGSFKLPAQGERPMLACLTDDALGEARHIRALWPHARLAVLPADTSAATWAEVILEFWSAHG